VCVLGIDTVREKLLYQTRWLAARGVDVDVLTMHRNEGSIGADASARIVPLAQGALPRARQVVRHLRANRGRLHHVELYVGGRFAVVHALLCRIRRVPLLVVERGDLLMCQRRVYPLSARISIYACYLLANRIWYKEPYMGRFFARWRPRSAYFLPNAVPVPAPADTERDLDLLWVNRLVPERHPDWLADALAALAQRPRTAIVGFVGADDPSPRVCELEARVRTALEPLDHVDCVPFGAPEPYYERARFFVLPADVVFGNFALLEAMARGVVPIVSDVEGARDVVDDGVNGIVAAHSAAGLRAALERALAVPVPAWEAMSAAARATVAERFGLDAWGTRLMEECAAFAATA